MNRPFVKPYTLATLDVGSSKVACIIAHITGRDKKIEIVGYGYNASKGIKNGVITDINQATLSICNAVESAEQMANERINNVIVNISGEKTRSISRSTSISLHKNRPISESDIEKIINKSHVKINVPDNELIHCIPTKYRVDGGEVLKTPKDIYGETLSLELLLGYYPEMMYKNLSTVIENAHLEIFLKSFSAYASALACMVDDEKEFGATVVDIGGGTTSIVTFKDGFPTHFSTIPVGGNNITNDIAWGLTTSYAHAEDLKIRQGCAFLISQDETETINVYPVGEEDDNSIKQIHKSDLISIIAPRVEEIFEMINKKLTEHGLKDVVAHRVILTGGCSLLPGIRDLAALILDKQVRLGVARNIPNIPKELYSPIFSTSLGMLLFATNYKERKPTHTTTHTGMEIGSIKKIISWFKQNF